MENKTKISNKKLNTMRQKRKKYNKDQVFGTKEKQDLLKTLIETSCNFREEENLIGATKKDPQQYLQTIKKFVEQEAHNSQSEIENTMTQWSETGDFERISNLIKYLEAKTDKSTCKYEIPLALKTIADLEEHPPFEEIDGIEIKSLYQLIANLSMGYPTNALNKETRIVLHQYFDEFREVLDSTQFSSDVETLQNIIDRNKPITSPPKSTTDFQTLMDNLFMNPALNPLNIPHSFLTNANKRI